jgi:hypothetical protein
MSRFRPRWSVRTTGPSSQPLRKLPLVLAGILLAVCVTLFGVIVHSMWTTLREEAGSTRFDLLTGSVISASDLTLQQDEITYLAITAVALDEATSSVTVRISGHRVCKTCEPLTLQLFALDRDPEDWWGLPPSDSFDLPNETTPFTQTLSLPLFGSPQRYPFDSYGLQMGVSVEQGQGGGEVTYLTADDLRQQQILLAVNEQVPRFRMVTPTSVPLPANVVERGMISALDLEFRRPAYLPIVAILLIALIFISSVLSTVLQETGEVFLGVGSIILGVWGISSIVVQTSYKGLTFVDLSLATVIMIVLLGITIRGALVIARRPSRG